MRPALFTGLVLFVSIVMVLAWNLRNGDDTAVPAMTKSDADPPSSSFSEGPSVAAETVTREMPVFGEDPESASLAMETARATFEQSMVRTAQEFRDDLQAFIDAAELLPAQDHEPGARKLLAQVQTLEDNGYLTPPEALALRLSLLRYALPPDDYRAAAETLVSEARQRAEEAERDWAARSDPRHEAYRKLEREIVEESLAMDEFPDGMTRQAYLRERLTALRSEIYSPNWSGVAGE